MVVDRTVDRLAGTGRLNPLHYTGTITTFLVVIIIATGAYLTMFYQFGFDASYGAVEAIESRWVGRIMRAAHRYASIGAVAMTLIHAWRTFVMDRFRGARWVPWISGIGMTVLLWLAGITGYWMIWDTRAGPLNDALTSALGSSRLGLDFLLDIVTTETAGSGWVFLLILFSVHLLLTGIIAWFYWYHVKRLTRRRFLPPREWLWVIGLVLLGVSVVLPVGMLEAYDPSRFVESIPFDPFYLFLLEPVLDWPPAVTWGAAGLLLLGALALPWLLRRRTPLPPIVIDGERCTGCTLCVADCPYRALRMVPQPEGRHRQLAVVDPELCVSCGICIGSCPELAMAFDGTPAEALWDDLARRVESASRSGDRVEAVFTCERHLLGANPDWLSSATDTDRSVVTALPCIGMAHPDLVGAAREAGADQIRFVGCPTDDCANLEGNTWLAARIARTRLPRLSKTSLDVPVSIAWITPGSTVGEPSSRPDATPTRTWLRPTVLMAAGLFVLVAATWWTYQPSTPEAALEITLDHTPGVALVGFEASPPIGPGPARLVVRIDGSEVLSESYRLSHADDQPAYLALERVPVMVGNHDVTVTWAEGDSRPVVLFDDTVALERNQILRLDYRDQAPSADAEEGRRIFTASSIGASAGCQICHSLEPDVILVGPSLYGIADAAGLRVPGLDAAEYLRESIIDPDAYVVDGFPAGQMLSDFATRLSDDEIGNLVTFLLTLEEER